MSIDYHLSPDWESCFPHFASLDYLVSRIWEELRMVKIYTKKRGAHPDLDDPVCLHTGSTIEVSSIIVYIVTVLLTVYSKFAIPFIGL